MVSYVWTPKELSIGGAVEEANRLVAGSDTYYMPQQFEYPDNPDIHYKTTAREIYEQLEGKVDIFVANRMERYFSTGLL